MSCTTTIPSDPAPDAAVSSLVGDPTGATTPAIQCPSAGSFCGGNGLPGDAHMLFRCLAPGDAPASAEACSLGCTAMPRGTNDFCAVACPTGGDYCGDNGVGGPAGFVFHCGAAGAPPPSYTACSGACLHEPNGINDICANGCSAHGAAALQWEANQLAAGNTYSDLCLGFANQAYRAAGYTLGYLAQYDAYDALLAAQATGHFVPWNGSCPCGAVLFWGQNACNGNYGHVVLCTGDGDMSTAGWPGFGGTPHQSIAWMSMEECGHAPAGYIVP